MHEIRAQYLAAHYEAVNGLPLLRNRDKSAEVDLLTACSSPAANTITSNGDPPRLAPNSAQTRDQQR